jgi:uncharacterized protein DUF58
VPGDEVRHLHWKATARTGRLMVRDLADPHRSRTTVLLDNRPEVFGEALFEEAVDVAASLLCASAHAAQDTRLITWSGLQVVVQGGRHAIRRLLDELSEVHADATGAAPTLPAGGGLVVVTGAPVGGAGGPARGAGAALEAVTARRPQFATVVLVALGGPIEAPAGIRVLRADGAEEAVRQWNNTTV